LSNLIVRLLLSILLIPSAMIVFIVAGVATGRHARGNSVYPFVLAGVITWGFVAAYWTGVWRSAIRWDSRRSNETLFITAAAALIALAIGAMLNQLERELGDVIGAISAPLLWLIGTLLVWRERPDERMERLRSAGLQILVCPACGYNLTGLKEARCPECGLQMTLDQLVAAQPTQVGKELDDE
jgi:hypothetical protein